MHVFILDYCRLTISCFWAGDHAFLWVWEVRLKALPDSLISGLFLTWQPPFLVQDPIHPLQVYLDAEAHPLVQIRHHNRIPLRLQRRGSR